MEIVRRGAWNICKLMVLSTSLCETKGIDPECWPIVVGTHHFGCEGASPSIEAAYPFMKFSHDIVYLLAVQTFEQGCC